MIATLAHRLLGWLQRQSVRYLVRRMAVGDRVKIRSGLHVTKPENITIGNDVSIHVNCVLQAHAPIEIGDMTLVAANCTIVTANHDVSKTGLDAFYTLIKAPVKIGRECWLGAGVLVLPGVTIGDGCVVGGGSVVTHDLPPRTICVGVPARPIRDRY